MASTAREASGSNVGSPYMRNLRRQGFTKMSPTPKKRTDEIRKQKKSLVRLYRGHRLLWDSSDPDYTDVAAKNSAWDAIASALNMLPDKVKVNVNILRIQFFRAHKLMAQKVAKDPMEQPRKWWLYDDMTFLLNATSNSKVSEQSHSIVSFAESDVSAFVVFPLGIGYNLRFWKQRWSPLRLQCLQIGYRRCTWWCQQQNGTSARFQDGRSAIEQLVTQLRRISAGSHNREKLQSRSNGS